MNINYTCNEINDQFIIHCIALTFHTPFSPPQVEVWSLHHPAESIKYKSKKLIWFHIHKYKYVVKPAIEGPYSKSGTAGHFKCRLF